MTTKSKIPKLDLHSSRNRKIRQQKSTKRSQRSKYYSHSPAQFDYSAHHKYYSPSSHLQSYESLSSPRSSVYQTYGPACGSNYTYPKGFHQNIGFPNHYLDYQPQMPYYRTQRVYNEEYMIQSKYDNYEYSPRYEWKAAEHDITIKSINKQKQIKEDMYTQTPILQNKQKAINTQKLYKKQTQYQNSQKPNEQHIQIFKKLENQQNIKNKKLLDQLQNEQNYKQKDQYTFQQNKQIQQSPIPNRFKDEHIIKQQPIIHSDFSHSSLSIQNKQNPQQYKKTFSQAILDEILGKSQKDYEQKYNSDNRYSQVIVGKIHKNVEIKQNISKYEQIKRQQKRIINNITENQENKIEKQELQKLTQQNRRLNQEVQQYKRMSELRQNRNIVTDNNGFQKYDSNINRIYKNKHQYNGKNNLNIRSIQLESANTNNRHQIQANNYLGIRDNRNNGLGDNVEQIKMQPRYLNKQTTVNVVVNRGDDRNKHLRDSVAQTNDQSNQNSRNQVIQTDNSRNHLIFQKLVKNIIDDQQFRRRINQKTDQFNNIKIQFEDDSYIHLNDLIDSKDAYVRYSREFLQKLNNIIQDQKYMIRTDRSISKTQQTQYLSVPPRPPSQVLVSPPIQNIPQIASPQVILPQQMPLQFYQQRNYQAKIMNQFQRPQQNVIVSVPLGPPVIKQIQPNFYPQLSQQIGHPMPQQVLQQVRIQRNTPNSMVNINRRTN